MCRLSFQDNVPACKDLYDNNYCVARQEEEMVIIIRLSEFHCILFDSRTRESEVKRKRKHRRKNYPFSD